MSICDNDLQSVFDYLQIVWSELKLVKYVVSINKLRKYSSIH